MAALLLGVAPAGANETPAPPEPAVEPQESAGESSILAIIRAPAPKLLTEKLMEVARQIQPGPQTEALPFMLGGMLGDPMLEGFSATENIGVALIMTNGAIKPVLLLRLTEESPLRESLPNFEMSLRDFGGWTFALPEGASSALVEGRQEALISAVRADRRYDLELAADGPELARKLREAYQEIPDMGGIGTMFVRPMIEGLAAEADSVSDFRVGLNISREQIEQVYYMQAAPGSAMAAFFNQERPENFDFARFIRADEAVAYLGGFDVAATRKYFDHFFDALSREAEGTSKGVWQEFRDLATSYFESTDGRAGGVMSLEGMELQMAAVTPSTMSDKELLVMLTESVEAMEKMLEDGSEDSPTPVYKLLPNHLELSGISVHVLRSEVKLDEETAAELEEQMPEFSMPNQRQDMYYAVVGGYMLNASDADRMVSLIEAVQKGEPVENNLASLIQLDEQNLFEFQVDLVRYFGGIMSVLMPAEMGSALQELERKGLKPMKGTATAQSGEAEVRLSLPVDTVVAAYQAMAAFMASQQQQQEQQEEEPAAPVLP